MKKLVRKKKVEETTLILYNREDISHSFKYKKYLIKPYYFLQPQDDLWQFYHKKKFLYIFVDCQYGQYGDAPGLVKKLDFYKVLYKNMHAWEEDYVSEKEILQVETEDESRQESGQED